MNLFFLNLCAALLVAFALGNFSLGVLGVGFIAGYAALWILTPLISRASYVRTFPKVVGYVGYVLWALLLSSIRVAKVVLSPRPRISPGIIAVSLDVKNEWAVFVLANSITLTPGTLSLSISEDKKTLFVHGMFIEHPDAFRKDIKLSFERKILEFLR